MKIKLINYQAHADSELDIVPGINVIVGRSDSGKSSVIRAIEAVANGGVMDKRHGTKQAEVHIDDCRRVRSGTKNHFELGSQVYKAMRTETPREIVNQLNLSDVNFRPQHSPYFLLSDSPGAVARSMNEFADLGLIDFVVGRAKQEAKAAADVVKRLHEEEIDASAKYRALDWAVEADALLQEVERLESKQLSLEAELEATEKTLAGIVEVERWLDSVPKFTAASIASIMESLTSTDIEDTVFVVAMLEEINAELARLPVLDVQPLARTIERLTSLVDPEPVQRIVDETTEVESELRLVPSVEVALRELVAVKAKISDLDDPALVQDIIDLIESAPDNGELLISLIEGAAKVEALVSSIDDVALASVNQLCRTLPLYDGDIDNLKAEIEWMNTDYKKLLTDAGVCPTCGREV